MAFGGLVARFGIFWRPLHTNLGLETATLIVVVCMKLHNVCIDDRLVLEPEYDPVQDCHRGVRSNYWDGDGEDGMERGPLGAAEVDGPFVYLTDAHFWDGDGEVPLQDNAGIRPVLAQRVADFKLARPRPADQRA